MRTNIEIDDAVMERALALTGVATKREVVDRALREMVERAERLARQRAALDEMRGIAPDWGEELGDIPFEEWPDYARHLRHDEKRYGELRAKAERLTAERARAA